ncbi:hypothetical protein K474DRAFT_1680237 [Panus rudis PR-1116 ss-1]|nr:hypothetical protein K474DRAFT_1680237 [Panus rudis PR-1116 ss-1]
MTPLLPKNPEKNPLIATLVTIILMLMQTLATIIPRPQLQNLHPAITVFPEEDLDAPRPLLRSRVWDHNVTARGPLTGSGSDKAEGFQGRTMYRGRVREWLSGQDNNSDGCQALGSCPLSEVLEGGYGGGDYVGGKEMFLEGFLGFFPSLIEAIVGVPFNCPSGGGT